MDNGLATLFLPLSHSLSFETIYYNNNLLFAIAYALWEALASKNKMVYQAADKNKGSANKMDESLDE